MKDAQQVIITPPLSTGEGIFWGGVGGFLGALSDLFAWQKVPDDERPWWFKNTFFWVSNLILLPLTGSILAAAWNRSGTDLTSILAINLGVSAPLVISRLALAAPIPKPGTVAD